MTIESFANPIIQTITHYNNGEFDAKIINDFIIEITDKKDQKYYLIFEPKEIFCKVDDLTLFLELLDKVKFESENILRIPFFAGCSGYDLGYFLTGNNISLSKELDQKISFEILPIDFNILGLHRFLNYVDMLYDSRPIFKSNNTFGDYLRYFEKVIQEKDDKINMIIPPIGLISRSPKTPFLKAIIENYEEAQYAKTGSRPQLRPTDQL
jgi:hypothetical protein